MFPEQNSKDLDCKYEKDHFKAFLFHLFKTR